MKCENIITVLEAKFLSIAPAQNPTALLDSSVGSKHTSETSVITSDYAAQHPRTQSLSQFELFTNIDHQIKATGKETTAKTQR